MNELCILQDDVPLLPRRTGVQNLTSRACRLAIRHDPVSGGVAVTNLVPGPLSGVCNSGGGAGEGRWRQCSRPISERPIAAAASLGQVTSSSCCLSAKMTFFLCLATHRSQAKS